MSLLIARKRQEMIDGSRVAAAGLLYLFVAHSAARAIVARATLLNK